jgi:predicted membrane protein
MFLLRGLDIHVPSWLYHPSSFLIAIGIVVLIKHKFQNITGYILILIGVLFKLRYFFPDVINLNLIFPLIAIVIGVSMVMRSKDGGRREKKKWDKIKKNPGFMGFGENEISPDDFVDSVSIFGSVKKQITTKTFKGADMFTLFGGTEINLTQASFESKAVIDLVTIFGGAEIIVPSDWHVRSEIVSILGGVEDNRYHRPVAENDQKVLVLKGTCVFGGVEIKSYGV